MNISGGLYGQSLYAGTLTGTVKIAVELPEVPVRREVVLFLEDNASADNPGARTFTGWTRLGSRFSHPDTGAWTLPDLDPAQTYTVGVWDSAGEYDPAIKSGLTPA